MNKIEKPTAIAVRETKQKLINVINESGLYITLIEMIMKELYTEVKHQSDIVYQQELIHYQNALAEAQNQEEESKKEEK